MTTAEGHTQIKCDGTTVREVIEQAIALEPRMRPRIFRDDGRMYVGVFLNGRNINAFAGLDTPISQGDELRVMPLIAGG